jgi:hypothetical protein
MRRTDPDESPHPVPVNADLEIEDRILGPFTARQTAYLAVGAVLLWLGYTSLRHLVPLPVLALAVLIMAGALTVAVTTRRDGLTLDRFLGAAARHYSTPRRRVTATEQSIGMSRDLGPLDMPVVDVAEPGVLDLGLHGAAALVECGTVNLDLRSGAEANAVLGAFARALNAMGGPFQFTISAHRIDLTQAADHRATQAGTLAHPLLQTRARQHAAYLRDLAEGSDLTARRVLLVVREPGPAATAAVTAAHRAIQTAGLLAACGIDTRVLDAEQAAAAITAACDPQRDHPVRRLATPGNPVTLATDTTPQDTEPSWH